MGRGFESLECYQLALAVLRESYKIADGLPKHEQFGMAKQLRGAALSAILNIAEGYGRYHYVDSLRFYYIARGSLSESLSAVIAAQTVGYITAEELNRFRELVYSAMRSLNGYIAYVQRQRQGQELFGKSTLREEPAEYLP